MPRVEEQEYWRDDMQCLACETPRHIQDRAPATLKLSLFLLSNCVWPRIFSLRPCREIPILFREVGNESHERSCILSRLCAGQVVPLDLCLISEPFCSHRATAMLSGAPFGGRRIFNFCCSSCDIGFSRKLIGRRPGPSRSYHCFSLSASLKSL